MSRQQTVHEESDARMMKHANDTQWAKTPTRERLAATRKRTLSSVSARCALSVWSKCQSRVIESRKVVYRRGPSAHGRGDSTITHRVSRLRKGTQAKCIDRKSVV